MIHGILDDVTPDRFFTLLLALQTRGTVTTADLAEQAGVSVRTVLRDLRWLEEAGFPILIQRGRLGGVTLLPGGALDTTRLTPGERDDLALGGLDDDQRRRLGSDGARARAKVAVRHRPPGSPLPLSAVVTTDNRPWFGPPPQGSDPSALAGDVRRGVRLRIHYRHSSEAEPAWRLVDPYGLLAKAGRWYLVADRAGVPRLYSLERLDSWQATRAARRLRPGVTLDGVVAELTAGWERIDALQVQALLAVRQLERARRLLGSRLTVRSVAGGEAAITVACRELEDVRQLLPFADDLVVTDPPEARDRMRTLATRTAGLYA